MEIIKSCCLMCTQECTTCIQYTSGSYVFCVSVCLESASVCVHCRELEWKRIALCEGGGIIPLSQLYFHSCRFLHSICRMFPNMATYRGPWASLTSLCFQMGCDLLIHRYLRYLSGMQTAMSVWVQTWNLERMDWRSLGVQSMINDKLQNSIRGWQIWIICSIRQPVAHQTRLKHRQQWPHRSFDS